jgi:hypothetical protein
MSCAGLLRSDYFVHIAQQQVCWYLLPGAGHRATCPTMSHGLRAPAGAAEAHARVPETLRHSPCSAPAPSRPRHLSASCKRTRLRPRRPHQILHRVPAAASAGARGGRDADGAAARRSAAARAQARGAAAGRRGGPGAPEWRARHAAGAAAAGLGMQPVACSARDQCAGASAARLPKYMQRCPPKHTTTVTTIETSLTS